MDTQSYVNFIIKLIESTRSNKKRLKILIYAFIVIFLTPFLNNFIEKEGIYRLISEKALRLSFEYLTYDLNILIIIGWILFWLTLFLLVEFLVSSSIKIWQFLNKFIKQEYRLSHENWPKGWILQGGISLEKYQERKTSKSQLAIALSNSGCLLRGGFWCFPTRWKNFNMDFDLIFPSEESRAMGIIFRAEDLENYYMLQIRAWKEEGHEILIKPHVRLYGNWEVIDLKKEDLLNHIKFDSTTRTLHVRIEIKDLFASIFIKKLNTNESLIYKWSIPSNTEPNLIQHEKDEIKAGLVPTIPFRNSYGMIGFRAYPGEKAIIRNLKVRSI